MSLDRYKSGTRAVGPGGSNYSPREGTVCSANKKAGDRYSTGSVGPGSVPDEAVVTKYVA